MTIGTLYLVPAPLGEDVWPIAAEIKQLISRLQVFAVENPRTTRRHLKRLESVAVQTLRFFSLAESDQALRILLGGEDVGLMSEAGCPGVADPGAVLVALAHENGIRVVPFTGPCAIVLALMASGMNGQRFAFHGYLPIEKTRRAARIAALERDSKSRDETQIFIETPYRNDAMLQSLLATLSPNMRLCLASDLTLPTETIRTDTIARWKRRSPRLEKRPTVFLISASAESRKRR
ncbi:MAG: SAM-dependent methyltransferase [Burkholderiales bacterium]